MILQTDYTRRIWTGLTTDDWGDADLREGDVIYLMDASECYVSGEGQMYQLPDLGGGGFNNIVEVTITSNRSQTTLAQAVGIAGIAKDNGYSKGTDIIRGGRTITRKIFMADPDASATRSYLFFMAVSGTLPMTVSCNVSGSTVTYYTGNMQALLSIPYSSNPITITLADQS